MIYDEAKPEDVPGLAGLLAEKPQNVLFSGTNGVGKSYAAAILAHEWDAQWVNTMELLVLIRRTYSPHSETTEAALLKDLREYRVLVLDDLMAAGRTEHGLSTVLHVVNGRLEAGQVTVVTCEKSLEAVDEWDSSLASRLLAYRRIMLLGKDRRATKGVERWTM